MFIHTLSYVKLHILSGIFSNIERTKFYTSPIINLKYVAVSLFNLFEKCNDSLLFVAVQTSIPVCGVSITFIEILNWLGRLQRDAMAFTIYCVMMSLCTWEKNYIIFNMSLREYHKSQWIWFVDWQPHFHCIKIWQIKFSLWLFSLFILQCFLNDWIRIKPNIVYFLYSLISHLYANVPIFKFLF